MTFVAIAQSGRRVADFLQSGASAAALVRIGIWILSIVVALMPAIYSAKARVNFDLQGLGHSVNHNYLFRDFFYIVIVASILSLTNIWERIFHSSNNTNVWIRAVCLIIALFFIYVLLYGTMEFVNIESLKAVSEPEITDDVQFVGWVLSLGIIVEALSGIVGHR